MKALFSVFRKELIDTLRDRRTLIMMVLLPLVFYPGLVGVTTYFAQKHTEDVVAANVKVLLDFPESHGSDLRSVFAESALDHGFEISEAIQWDRAEEKVLKDEIDVIVRIDESFDLEIAGERTGKIELIYKRTDMGSMMINRVEAVLEAYDERLRGKRLQKRGLTSDYITPIEIERNDVASARERSAGGMIGGMFTYFLIFFVFAGGMGPAVDLGAGEKERGTLETVLTSPVPLGCLLGGKLIIVALAGIVSAMLTLGAVIPFMLFGDSIGDQVVKMLGGAFTFKSILAILALIVPLSLFFAAVMLSLSFYSRSAKEAHGFITPIMMVIVLILVIGMLPGSELTTATALIPVMNVSLAMRECMAGTIDPWHYALVYVTLLGLSATAIFLSARFVDREEVLFRR